MPEIRLSALSSSAAISKRSADTPPTRVALDPPPPPAWVARCISDGIDEVFRDDTGVLRVRDAGRMLWLEASVPRAVELDDAGFRGAVAHLYETLGEMLRERCMHALRWWNYLPDIRRPSGDGFSRYERFNAGRMDSCGSWLQDSADGRAPAATAVGHRGKDCVVQVLAATQSGVQIENPRQSPAQRYSRRYGPVAPRFARATLAPELGSGGERWATVSGTASIVGEESRHPGVLDAQLGETLENLASLARAIEARAGVAPLTDPLERYREVRAYVVRPGDASPVISRIRTALPELRCLEIAEADLCRPELMVELEGIVELG
jgi:chorismate lyase / 3-hydroxybenzoate synthase